MPNVEYRELKFAICTQNQFCVSRGTFHSDKFHPAAGEVVILDVYQNEAIFHSSFSLRHESMQMFGNPQGDRGSEAGSDPLEDHRDPLAHPDAHGA